jgi:ubiquinone/menaquinone biosynthesis C-methylase UbiE
VKRFLQEYKMPNLTPNLKSNFAEFRAFEKKGWEDVAENWHRHFETVSRQSIKPLLENVGFTNTKNSRGKLLLDVATGPGYGASKAAELGVNARGIDFSAAQIIQAKTLHPGIKFNVGDAEQLPYSNNEFDAVIINFGLNHFSDPDLALKETLRVLKPGGHIAFTTWAKPPLSVGFELVESAIFKFGNPDAFLPAGPNYYRFSEPDEAIKTLKKVGFQTPKISIIQQTWQVDDGKKMLEAIETGTVRAGALLRAQTQSAKKKIVSMVCKESEEYRNKEFLDIPMPAVLASATKIISH